ncbi:MAG: hypothetical protein J2P18_04135, partial [Nocardia sp.]|nr:hypothetical protein [Nocardia sp.]
SLGPFRSRTDAVDVATTLAEYTGLRTCTTRIPREGTHECPRAPVGGCPATIFGERASAAEYAAAPRAIVDLLSGRGDAPLRALATRIDDYVATHRFESAARLRDRMAAVVRAVRRTQRLSALARIAELIAAQRSSDGGWEFAVIRYGRLAAAGTSARGVAPMPVVEALVATAETVLPARLTTTANDPLPGLQFPDPGSDSGTAELGDDIHPPLRGAPPEETALIAGWLERPGTRIVRTTAGYREPRLGAGPWLSWAERADAANRSELTAYE